ncbi:MAG: hypothetical protein ACI4OJ_00255 [Lachnospiraceae bacterium]
MKDRFKQVLAGEEENYILPFFWQHGEDAATLREYVRAIHDCNIGAFCVESRPHPDFAGPGWWRDMDIILEEAKTLGMKVWILDDSHFPTGIANGALKTAPKELHHLYLGCNTLESAGPKPQVEFRVEDMIHPPVLPPWIATPKDAPAPIHDDRCFHILACPVLEDAGLGTPVLLDSQVRAGTFRWDVPEGYWRIFVIYLTYDGRGRNDYINFLDASSCRLQIDAVYEPHWEHCGKYFGNVIEGFFSDEPPIGNTPGYTMMGTVGTEPDAFLPWSRAMEAAFTESFGGAGWTQLLPYLWGRADDKAAAARVRTAYMDAVTRLVRTCFSDQLGSWCEAHGVSYIGHMLEDVDANSKLGPSMGHFFRGLDGQHMAGVDNIGSCLEIGAQHTGRHRPYETAEALFYHYELGKLAASHAAIDPKKQGRAMCENFGAYGWETGVRTMKYLTDELLVRGVNYFVPHAFTPRNFPDPDCPPHFYAHGENPQYHAFGSLMRYANRVCHLISGGVSKPSAAILYHGEADWAGSFLSNAVAAKALSTSQLDYQIIPADVFEETERYRTTFDGKTLCVNGTKYHALVLCGSDFLCRAAAVFAAKALQSGFPVVFVGGLPEGIADPREDAGEAELMAAVRTIPVVQPEELAAWLSARGLRDVEPEAPCGALTIYHYQNGRDCYLILNEDPGRAYSGTIRVAAEGRPVRYDAWDNTVCSIPYQAEAGRTSMTLTLAPLELAIVIFDAEVIAEPAGRAGEEKILHSFVLSGYDAKSCRTGREKPAIPGTDTRTLGLEEEDGTLKSAAIAYPDFSGWLSYETEVSCEGALRAELVLEDAWEGARVFVNGKDAGERVAQPYRFKLDGLLQNGTNRIRIDVATTLERRMRAAGVDTFSMNLHHPVSPTGIIGKVRLIFLKHEDGKP